jgi:presenilin-like A22 family membrane protease
MKHNYKITFVLLAMFLITQFIGFYVVQYYSPVQVVEGIPQNVSDAQALPYGMQPPAMQQEKDFYTFLPSLIIAFILAITLVFLLTKFEMATIIKLWFFVVIIIALGISLNTLIPKSVAYSSLIAAVIALPLAYIKTYKKEFIVHNITELFIYPGIAAVFVPILNIWTIIILLILISVYDMWAVWHSGIMQKMAKYQINKLNVFSGFFLPYADQKTRKKIKLMKQKIKEKKISKTQANKKSFKVNVAILGGGDVIFPIIAAGVFMKTFGFIPALFVTLGATLGLAYLFFCAEKKKFYPAMPYITTGILLGMLAGYFLV